MARIVWLLRHGDAEPHGARDDFERRLTARGERQATRGRARAGASRACSFEAVYTSPRVRALRHRAAGVRRARAASRSCTSRSPAASTRATPPSCSARHRGAPAVLLVGHEPDLSGLVAALTGARIEMKKGGLAAIGGGALLALLRPREIELVAGL